MKYAKRIRIMIFRQACKIRYVRGCRQFALQLVSAVRMQRMHTVTYIARSPVDISKRTRVLWYASK